MLCPNNSLAFFVQTILNPGGPPAHSNVLEWEKFLEWKKSNSSRSQIELEVAKMVVAS
jgi:hypothetical protein